ncbi:hypothetical protein LK07_32955 [Streptomyces pluripotens]|uniref:Uncharacterized protein n=1 Tax=Streptomyces pluripotens TaxID=1355015 RepID=A0A221P7C7_9ACTN|nr:hypothetical protein LK06_031755 [Streptomyces pluripotens]ASN28024.1 hypothetical protein LK07_32955 [Streptomyces pluripotens]KIE27932.1 hypothetical protein LK08_05665 [Streptomyces sp. MUSC 125]
MEEEDEQQRLADVDSAATLMLDELAPISGRPTLSETSSTSNSAMSKEAKRSPAGVSFARVLM